MFHVSLYISVLQVRVRADIAESRIVTPSMAAPALLALRDADEEGEEASQSGRPPWPAKGLLAARWEQRAMVREQMRQNKKLLLWPSPVTTGVASQNSLKLNRYIIYDVLEEWGKVCEEPVAPPIGWLRQEARFWTWLFGNSGDMYYIYNACIDIPERSRERSMWDPCYQGLI